MERANSNRSRDEGLAQSASVYDRADHDLWRFAVYDGIHSGWEFANICGAAALNAIASLVPGRDKRILDVGCGSGDPCIYLSAELGCNSCGVDINPNQIARALGKRDALGSDVARMVSFWCGALGDFPQSDFHAACCLDTLTLVDDTASLLSATRARLGLGSPFLVADLFAGRNYDRETEKFVWSQDGMISLVRPQRFADTLDASRFACEEWADNTKRAENAFVQILSRLDEYVRRAPAQRDDALVDEWFRATRFYIDAFHEHRLEYRWCVSRAR